MSSKSVHHEYGSILLREKLDQTRFDQKVPVLVFDPSLLHDITSLLELVDMYKANGIPFVIKGHTRFFPPAADWLKGNGELGVEAMKLSIGKANVSVIDKQYNGDFKDSMTVTEYVDDHWLKGDKELYMHQYQFPLDTDPGTTLSIPFPLIPPCFSLTYSSLLCGQ